MQDDDSSQVKNSRTNKKIIQIIFKKPIKIKRNLKKKKLKNNKNGTRDNRKKLAIFSFFADFCLLTLPPPPKEKSPCARSNLMETYELCPQTVCHTYRQKNTISQSTPDRLFCCFKRALFSPMPISFFPASQFSFFQFKIKQKFHIQPGKCLLVINMGEIMYF